MYPYQDVYVWLFSTAAVFIISLCGLLSVAIIPLMQKRFYHTLLQFLVGLAIGSLTADGLLHLMPHAILGGKESHIHYHNCMESLEEPDVHDDNRNLSSLGYPFGEGIFADHNHNCTAAEPLEETAIWRGLTTLIGIFCFYIVERLVGLLTTYRRQQKEAKNEDDSDNKEINGEVAQSKKSTYYQAGEGDLRENVQMLEAESESARKATTQQNHEVAFHGRSNFRIENDSSVLHHPNSESCVIVSNHHGHSHGHSHEIPHSISSVAWMVIMGDGLHNFCDGLAIGAAFASSPADGISTSLAVFCHELPHELGDFAMLLKTGMTVKQALLYNGLSSILCLMGMTIGIFLGNVNSATNWVFAFTAGMFFYIALVDMLPELTSGIKPGKAAISILAVQIIGISLGICIMLVIALYEHTFSSFIS